MTEIEAAVEENPVETFLNDWTRRLFGDMDIETLTKLGQHIESARNFARMPYDPRPRLHQEARAVIERHGALMLEVESDDIGRLQINKAKGMPPEVSFYLPDTYRAGATENAIKDAAGFTAFSERLAIHGFELMGVSPKVTRSDQSLE